MVTCQMSVSLDGFAAGPNQRPDEPLGDGAEALHTWMFDSAPGDGTPDADIVATMFGDVGAYIMGRNMFAGPGDGPWAADWRGWWGEDPPYHRPVFVLTHHPREALAMGDTTFFFVDDADAALAQARAAAGDGHVHVAGGAKVVQQYLRSGAIDELHLHTAPVLLGAGERLLDDLGDVRFDVIETIASPRATHVRYRVG